jgi:hypothetical protein
MARLQEGTPPTKAEVALLREVRTVITAWTGCDGGDGTGPGSYPLPFIPGLQYRAKRLAELQTAGVEQSTAEGTLTRSEVAVEYLFHALAADDPAALRQALLEEAALLLLWVEDIDHR